jgi:hypothetical protein
MTRKALRSVTLLTTSFLFGLLSATTANAAAVMKRGKDAAHYIVSQDADRPFKDGDFLCVYHEGKAVACGDVIQVGTAAAALKLTMKKKDMEVNTGDQVVHAKRPGASRAPASNQTREEVERPSSDEIRSHIQVSGEVLGTGILYSIYGSYRFSEMFAVNVGASYIPISATDGAVSASASILNFPASLSLFLFGKSHMLDVTAGADLALVSGSGSVFGATFGSASKTVIIPEFGLGYRYWPKNGGFHFRVMAYGVIVPSVTVASIDPTTLATTTTTTGGLIPTVGVSFGYAF